MSIIVPELKFGNVQVQIFLADLTERPDNTALQDRPEAFDCVRMNCANDMLADSVIAGLMIELMLQSQIAGISIGAEKANAVRYGFPHESLKSGQICVLNDASNDVSFALDCADNRRLARIAPPPRTAFLVPMPVLVVAADVRFVNFDNPSELLDVFNESGSDLVAHEPSGLIGAKPKEALNLEGAHAFLADQHQVRDSKPILQWLICVLKDCAGQVREAIAVHGALSALPMMTGRERIDFRIAATGADNLTVPTAGDQVVDAIVLSLKKRVELRCGQLMNWFWPSFPRHSDASHSVRGILHA